MWEVLLGTAAANKIASIGVGLSVLLGTAGAAEVTGIGPTVREIVRSEVALIQEQDTDEDIEIVAATELDSEGLDSEAILVEEEDENVDHPQDDREQFVTDAEDAPGNLVWHLRGGAFNLRGLLVDDGDGLAVRTAGPDGETLDIPVDSELVTARIPGANGGQADPEATLEDYVGYLVQASGECTGGETAEDSEAECTVNELSILGNAGQSDDEVEAEIGGDNSEALTADEGEPGDDVHGKPEHAGGPKQNKPSED